MKKVATQIVKRLTDAGHTAYFAGGWVRDHLLKHPSDDIDIATTASVEQVQALFPKTIPVGVNFGIVIVVEEGHQFEVATFRKDRDYKDGRRPTGFDPATPEEDAKRRDFTINGMFFNPLTEEILDFVEGRKDLEKGVIRAIGNPHNRFAEDRLRMMRAVRYSTRFDFPIESETRQAILDHASELLPAVAMERVWQEFCKMSAFAHFDTGLISLHRLKLLPTIFPSLEHIAIEEIQKRVHFIEKFPKKTPTLIEMLELFPNHSLESLLIICERLKLSNEDRSFARFYHHATALLTMPEKWAEGIDNYEWVKFYADTRADLCLNVIAVKMGNHFLEEHEKRKELLKPHIQNKRNHTPFVTSKVLLEHGIKPGVEMGKLLKNAEKIAANALLEDREEILRRLKI